IEGERPDQSGHGDKQCTLRHMGAGAYSSPSPECAMWSLVVVLCDAKGLVFRILFCETHGVKYAWVLKPLRIVVDGPNLPCVSMSILIAGKAYAIHHARSGGNCITHIVILFLHCVWHGTSGKS